MQTTNISIGNWRISPLGVFVFVFVAFRSSSRVVTAHYFVRLTELKNCDTKHTVQWNTFNDTIVVKLTYFSRTIRYCYNELGFDCAKVEVDQLVMSLVRLLRDHTNCTKIVAGCSAFAILTLTQITHGTVSTLNRTSCLRDPRTISLLSVLIPLLIISSKKQFIYQKRIKTQTLN